MKKTWLVFLMIAALLGSVWSFAIAETSIENEPTWYELEADGLNGTIRIPTQKEDGCEWSCVTTNEKALEVATSEDTSIESEDGQGVYAVSFRSAMEEFGDVAIIVKRTNESGVLEAYRLELSIAMTGTMQAIDASLYIGTGDWLTLSEDECVISVNLPANVTTGYAWNFEISDPQVVSYVSESYTPDSTGGMLGAGGMWSALFENKGKTEGSNGDATLTFRYQRGEEEPVAVCVAKICLTENGQFDIVSEEAAITSYAQME